MKVWQQGSNFLVGNYSATVGTTSTSLTANTTNITLPQGLFSNFDASYLITAENNSTAVDVTVSVYNLHNSFGIFSTNQWSQLTQFSVVKTASTALGTINDQIVQGFLCGNGGRLTINPQTTGSSDLNANVYFRVTKI